MTAESFDVVVVGGGFAGATAARELVAAGRSTVLVEARERLGGRTWTTSLGASTVELGGTWIHWSQPHIWAELTRYGIGVEPNKLHYDRAYVGSPAYMADPDETHLSLARGFARFVEGLTETLRDPYQPLTNGDAVRFADHVTMAERLDETGLSGRERDLVESVLYAEAGSPLNEAGILASLRWRALCDWSPERWAAINLRPVGGTRAIIDNLTSDKRLDVRLSSPVSRVVSDRRSVQLETMNGHRFIAGAAVIAVPINVLPHIDFLPELPASHIDAARRGMGKPRQDKVFFHVRGDIGTVSGYLPPPEPLNIFYTYRHLSDDEQILVAFNASPAVDVMDHAQVSEVIRRHVAEIETVFDSIGHSWSDSDPFARGGNSGPRPGVVTDHLDALQRPCGRLAFASADIANGWFGYMDGAVESGLRAARDIISILEREE